MNATAPDRQARLAAALRENLKRRKRQIRGRDAAQPVSQDEPQGKMNEPGGDALSARDHRQDDSETVPATRPARPGELKGSD